MNPWVMVETLAPDAMTVASVGDEPRNFANLQRAVQRLLAKIPPLHGNITAQDTIELIRRIRRRPNHIQRSFSTPEGAYALIAGPVLGPTRNVHGVRFWVGPVGTAPRPRLAVGSVWDLTTQTIRHTFAPPPGDTEPAPFALSVAELLHLAVGFDRQDEVLDFLYNPAPATRIQFDLTLRAPGDQRCLWRNTIRYPDDRTDRAHWLGEFITADSGRVGKPGLAQLAPREALRRAHIHLAVLQIEHTSIACWLTEPAPWIRWDRLPYPVDVFHADDRQRLAKSAADLRPVHGPTLTVRTLDHSGGYSPTKLQLFPCPGRATGHYAIGQFSAPE